MDLHPVVQWMARHCKPKPIVKLIKAAFFTTTIHRKNNVIVKFAFIVFAIQASARLE
jgi:hypothetical protein